MNLNLVQYASANIKEIDPVRSILEKGSLEKNESDK